jgi:antitoxin MazE
MRTTLRKVGNSRGVLIPAAFLSACQISNEIELRLEGGRIIIEPVTTVRQGWFDGYQAANDTEAWAGMAETATEEEDWQW